MSSVIIAGNTSGTITLDAPNVAGTTTLTLPTTSGTVLTSVSPASDLPSSIKGPAFSAYQSVQQTIASSATFTKITFTTVEFDTNSNFASSRFTPTVAGYYQVSAGVNINSTTWLNVSVYKNGSSYKYLTNSYATSFNGGFGSALVYCNGSTDYIEIYCSVGTTSVALTTGIATTYFQAAMIRSA